MSRRTRPRPAASARPLHSRACLQSDFPQPVSAATRSSAVPVFELKSAALTLIAVVVKTPDLALLAIGLRERLADTPDLFEREPIVVDVTPLRDEEAPIDFAALAALLREHGMVPVAVKGGNESQMAAAARAGLAQAPEGAATARRQPSPGRASRTTDELALPAGGAAPTGDSAMAVEPTDTGERAREGDGALAQQAAIAPEPAASPATSTPTHVIDRPLRSGQQVYARDADLVVLAAVSFGAEVIADGHVHVYGPLRGRAVAGAKGNTHARIFTTCMEPQLISIAGIYRTTETELPPDVLGKPAQVRLDGERLVIEPLAS